jgi:hypothetical protein
LTLEDLNDISAGDDRIESDLPMPHNSPQEQQMAMQQYNPFAPRQNSSWDAICMDRMLSIKRPATVSGEIWITEAGFAETLSLLPLNKAEQRKFWKKFRLIQMIAPGELSRKIVDSRQERLMMELVSQKSRLDAVEGGNINERGMWITSRQLVEQTLRTPSPQKPKGFIESVLSGTGR